MDSVIKKEKLAIKSLLNGLLSLMVFAMLLTNIILGGALYSAVSGKSRTLVPPSISQAFTVSDGQIDDAYLLMMADYFLFLKLNVTPANVDRQYGALLDYVNEDDWSAIQPKLSREALTIIENNISSHFNPSDTARVSLDTLQVQIQGSLQKYVGSRPLEPDDKWYEVTMRYDYGLISLHSITEIEVKQE